jgi:hypothetical protein
MQPVGQSQKLCTRGSTAQLVLLAFAFLFDCDAPRQTRLMHVDSTTARVNDFHIASFDCALETLDK